MEKFFKLKEKNTDVKTEVIAGFTTFMTMAYILAVNPRILGAAGMDAGAVFTATALASAIASFFMAILANLPFVLSCFFHASSLVFFVFSLFFLAFLTNLLITLQHFLNIVKTLTFYILEIVQQVA